MSFVTCLPFSCLLLLFVAPSIFCLSFRIPFVCVFSAGLPVLNKAWLSIVLFYRSAYISHSVLLSSVSLQYLPFSSTLFHPVCLSPLLVPGFSLTISFSMSSCTPFFQVSHFYVYLLSVSREKSPLPTCASLCFG
jgi:hypothetical protein